MICTYISSFKWIISDFYKVIKNVEKVLAIELFNAAQALEFRKPLNTSPYLQELLTEYRKYVPFIENDAIMYDYMDTTLKFSKKLKIQI